MQADLINTEALGGPIEVRPNLDLRPLYS
jgi:hypothetical protein